MVGWFALVAPTGTPAAAINRANRDTNAQLADVCAVRAPGFGA